MLNTDIVTGKDPQHIVHYMTQCAFAGKIQGSLLSEAAKFQPVYSGDLSSAVKHSMDSGLSGQFAVRGREEASMR